MDATVERGHSVRPIALVITFGAVAQAVFQAALALGAPFGRAAWGGQPTYLDTGLRVASAIAVPVWLFVAAVILRRGGYEIRGLSVTFARRATWVTFALLVLGTIGNVASRSALERSIWAPLSLVLTVLTFILARSDHPERTR